MDSRLAAYIAVLPPQPGQGSADSLAVELWPDSIVLAADEGRRIGLPYSRSTRYAWP